VSLLIFTFRMFVYSIQAEEISCGDDVTRVTCVDGRGVFPKTLCSQLSSMIQMYIVDASQLSSISDQFQVLPQTLEI
jgi:hypothetical protein